VVLRVVLCVGGLVGELDVLVRLVESISVALGVSNSIGVESVELVGDVCLSAGGVDGCMASSPSAGCGRLSDGIGDAGGASASTDILMVQEATEQTNAIDRNRAGRCLTNARRLCLEQWLL
jgi:hypothetical protein